MARAAIDSSKRRATRILSLKRSDILVRLLQWEPSRSLLHSLYALNLISMSYKPFRYTLRFGHDTTTPPKL